MVTITRENNLDGVNFIKQSEAICPVKSWRLDQFPTLYPGILVFSSLVIVLLCSFYSFSLNSEEQNVQIKTHADDFYDDDNDDIGLV